MGRHMAQATKQHRQDSTEVYDALKRIGWDTELMGMLGGEMTFIQELAHDHKISQGYPGVPDQREAA